ncbi:hypothetical protein HZH66_002474 [Vespula vulgaris]|uniref:Uncharacterized protein n=2 Tax=Vespula TaxID=7451 RepID=A0A834KL78_VESVU|nr:hypothetical protein HZH66_002474 [Vespula vulgaris]
MKADKTELTEKKVQKDLAIGSMPITETSIPIFPSVRISEAKIVPSILASSCVRQVTVLRTPQSSWKMVFKMPFVGRTKTKVLLTRAIIISLLTEELCD